MSRRNRGRVPVARHAGVHQDQNKRHPSSPQRRNTRTELEEFRVAWNRGEHEACQRGTPGCCVDHPDDRETQCLTW